MPSQEELERFAAFCKARSLDVADFRFVETPDFVSSDGAVGVELVGYHQDASRSRGAGSLRRIQESQIDRVLADARGSYFSSQRAAVEVFVFPHFRQRRPARDAALRLVEFVVESVHGKQPSIPAALSEVVDKITVTKTRRPVHECVWQVARADFADVHVPSVQAHLDAKEPLVPDYRRRARSVWLLVHSTAMPCIGLVGKGRLSGHGQITEELSSVCFKTSFERVFYLDGHTEACVELNIQAVGEGPV